MEIKSGTEVLIFNRIRDIRLDETKFVKGKIIEIKETDFFYHGSPWTKHKIVVLGEDGRLYIGKYGNAMEGIFFLTVEDYITHIYSLINHNNQNIINLHKENETYHKILSEIILENEEEKENTKKR